MADGRGEREMSRTLNLTCRACNRTLWVGQYSLGNQAWYLYGTGEERANMDAFVNVHAGHDVRFEDSELVPMDTVEVEEP